LSLGVAIVGAGSIGRKRAAALQQFDNCKLKVVTDVNRTAAEVLCNEFGGQPEQDWKKVVTNSNVHIVIVATINKFLAELSIEALENGKHVLCEKPLGKNSQESQRIIEAAKQSGTIIKTGFNHRHHPAIAKAKLLCEQGKFGQIMYLRCRYGHGGRPGYEKEWRANKDLCGGGELLDQGVHVVDLFRWFAGDFQQAFGYAPTYFWNMEVEDNAFGLFRTEAGGVASMHTSWTQWKNLFSFEVFGTDGFLIVEGLGGSYGTETLIAGRRRPEGGTPEEQTFTFPGPDISWQQEWKEFLSAIEEHRDPMGSGWDGLQANRMLEAVYKSAQTSQTVEI